MRGFTKQIVKKRKELLNKPKSNFNVISEKHMKPKRLKKTRKTEQHKAQQLAKEAKKTQLEAEKQEQPHTHTAK
ncbi:hypothetical protein ACO22_08144 [Paracoccidioides brasiliensis]|uniref:Uncharacterized protein n=1 Tax=Paracoccidioides brasiliensis TaxID=121759 RepID=A0A1D2J2N6_PARBR|nr:hypothetical protein ACO22_08144 [Paracoccidioides brasiliensis]